MGKPKHSDDPRGEQKGAQTHAEGDHGGKTYDALKSESINPTVGVETRSQREAHDPNRGGKQAGHEAEMHERIIENPSFENDGGHRLFENRIQHDEAEKNSEKNRRDVDMERHGHDPDDFQGRGGHSGHPATTPDHSASIKATGEGGGNRAQEEHGHHKHS